VLGDLDNLVKVRVKGLGHSYILHTVIVLGAEVKYTLRSLIVEVDHLGILSQGIKNDFADVNKECDLIHQALF
jgi:hypothetical protein